MNPTRTLQAIVQAAVAVTSATDGWLLHHDDGQLALVADAGLSPGTDRAGGVGGTAGFVAMSGQPVARRLQPGEAGEEGSILGQRHPGATSVLAVPCQSAASAVGPVGVLQLVGKQGAATFSIDDIELVTVLAGIAAAALEERTFGSSGADDPFASLGRARPDDHAALSKIAASLLGAGSRA